MKILKALEICTVNVCRCNCHYCGQKALKKGYEKLGDKVDFNNPIKLSWQTYTDCLKKVPKDVCIDFAGFVEPFFSDICADMMVYAHDQGYKLRLFTTISGMTLRDVDKIKHIPLLDCCYHVPDNLRILKVGVTEEYIRVVDHFLNNIGGSAHCFGPIHEKLEWIRNKRHVEDKKLTQEHLINRGGNVTSSKLVQVRSVKKTGKLWCKSPYLNNGGPFGLINYNVMDIYGNVYLCCCCYSLEHKLGNLLTDNYEDLFTGKEYNRVIEGLNGNEEIDILCRTCDMAVSQ